MTLTCPSCHRTLERRAYLCVERGGDEYVYSWFLCETCGAYAREVYIDRFMGSTHAEVRSGIPRDEGDAEVKRLRECATPDDKRCDCPVHRERC